MLDGNLPWALVFAGMAMAFCVEIMGLPTLAFAVGLYLPIHLATPIMAGGLIRWVVEKRNKGDELNERREAGVLYGSGLIAGAALVGVFGAVLTFFEWDGPEHSHSVPMALLAFGALAGSLLWVAHFRKAKHP